MHISLLVLAVFLLVYALVCMAITRADTQLTAAEHAARLRSDPEWTARETARLRAAPEPDAVASFEVVHVLGQAWGAAAGELCVLNHVAGNPVGVGDTLVVHKILRSGEPA